MKCSIERLRYEYSVEMSVELRGWGESVVLRWKCSIERLGSECSNY